MTDRDNTHHALLAGGAALALAALSLILLASPASAATASLTVNPSTGLKNGQSVTVSGAGFAPNASNINIVQCEQGATGAGNCNIGAGKFYTPTNGSGGFSVQLTVASKFGSTDCTKVTCMIVAHAGTDPNSGTTAQARISFAAAAAPSSSGHPSATASSTHAAGPAPGTTSASTTGSAGGAAPSAFPSGAVAGKGTVRTVPEFVIIAGALAGMFVLVGVVALVRRVHAEHR